MKMRKINVKMKNVLKLVMSAVVIPAIVLQCSAEFINICAAENTADAMIDLSEYYNRDIVNKVGETLSENSIMNAVFSYDGELIEAEYNANGRLASDATEYVMGSFNGIDDNCIDLQAAVTVDITRGVYESVNFLAGSPLANVDYTITLNYTDGTSSDTTVSIKEWGSTEDAVFSAGSRIRLTENEDGTYSCSSVSPVNEAIHEYSLPVTEGKIVQSVTFPWRPDFFIMAVTACQKPAEASAAYAESLITALSEKTNITSAELENAQYFADDAVKKGAEVSNYAMLAEIRKNLHTGTPVDLSSYYNSDIAGNVGSSENIAAVTYGGNQSFDAALLNSAFPNGAGQIGDITYNFGDFDGAENNAVYCGDGAVTILLPEGVYSGVSVIIAGAANSDVTVVFNYSDGTSSNAVLSVQDWTETANSIFSTTTRIKTTESDGSYTGESVAVTSALTEETLSATSGKILTGITIPQQKAIRLLALTAINCSEAETDSGVSIAIAAMENGVREKDAAEAYVKYALDNGFEITDIETYNANIKAANTYQCIDLTENYNTDLYLSTGEIDTSREEFFYSAWAYDEDLLASQMYKNEIICGNIGYKLGEFKSKENTGINLKLNAAEVALDNRIYNKLHFLMASKQSGTGKNYSVIINYCDGTEETVTIPLIESFDGGDSAAENGGILAAESARVRSTDGYSHTDGFMAANMYSYTITPAAYKTVKSLTFPQNGWLGLFAVTAENYSEKQLSEKSDLWIEEESISYNADGASICATVKSYAGNSSVWALAAVYNEGVLQSAEKCEAALQSDGKIKIEKTISGAKEGSVKLFVWESLDSMKPSCRISE